MTRKGKGSNNHPDKGAKYMPTPEEIEKACEEIRAGWKDGRQAAKDRKNSSEYVPVHGRYETQPIPLGNIEEPYE